MNEDRTQSSTGVLPATSNNHTTRKSSVGASTATAPAAPAPAAGSAPPNTVRSLEQLSGLQEVSLGRDAAAADKELVEVELVGERHWQQWRKLFYETFT